MQRSSDDSQLRRALRANAAFSAVCAAALLTGSSSLAGWLGAPRSILLGIGVGLALFVVDLLVTSAKRPIPRRKAVAFIAMDVAWVLGSGVALLVPTPLTSSGRLAVVLVGLIVAGFAVLQLHGYRTSAVAADGARPEGDAERLADELGRRASPAEPTGS